MSMIVGRWIFFRCGATASDKVRDGPLRRSPGFSGLSSILRPYREFGSSASLKCLCLKNQISHDTTKAFSFSVLGSETPWEEGNIWSTMAFYIFCLHVPLGYGGLSVVSYILRQPALDPQTEVLSLLIVQILELFGTVFLLRNAAKPQYESINFFKADDLRKERNWLLASALGFGFLVSFVLFSSVVADKLLGSKAVTNIEVKEIILNGEISRIACFVLYCVVAPIVEEIVYRRFLLTSLASSKMKWTNALVISSGIFAAAHFSVDNFAQLFIIGCVLGASYSWSGSLASSVLVHSLYNALTLLVTLSS